METMISNKLEKISKENYSTIAFKTPTFRKSYGTISTVFKYFYTNNPDFIFISEIYLDCSDRTFYYNPEKPELIINSNVDSSIKSRKSHLCEIFKYKIIKLFYEEKN